MKRNFAVLLSIIFLLLFVYNCKEEPPIVPPPPPGTNDTITISIDQVTHRSIVVDVRTTTNNPNSTLLLYRRINNTDTLVTEYPITITDTSIVDDNNGMGLQLDTEYNYYALRKTAIEELKDTSNIVIAKTLAATNFNYSWREFAFGEPGSVLFDVWGTDENNVYSCGVIIESDTVYGIIKWNGSEWYPEKKNGGLQAIFGFSGSDIWAVGGGVYHFDGLQWNQIDSYTSGGQSIPLDIILFNNLPYASIWGTNSNNVYFGNVAGKIIHWNGRNAEVVFTNSDIVQVRDLDGYASDFIIGVGTGLVPPLLAVKYDGTNWTDLPISSNWSLNSVSIVSKNQLYFGGDGVFEMIGNEFSQIQSFGYYIRDVKYNKLNGVTVTSSAFDGVYINNGLEWRSYKGQITTDNTAYNEIFLINNKIFCVGSTLNEAKIIIGNN